MRIKEDYAEEAAVAFNIISLIDIVFFLLIFFLAATTFVCNGATMPVVWKRAYGKGRVFYSSLGHCAKEFIDFPNVLELLVRGCVWAAEGKPKAAKK